MGARGGMIAPDEKTFEYIKDREFTPKNEDWNKAMKYWSTLKTDEGAIFDKEIEFVTGDEWNAGNLSYHLKSRPKWEGFTNNEIFLTSFNITSLFLAISS